jgi:hypothetical protein
LLIRTFAAVRPAVIAAILFASATAGNAQQQERKLIDRLLRPDFSLQNNAQHKQFVAEGTVTTKKATTKTFYVFGRSPEKKYTNVRNASVTEFQTKPSPLAQQKANTGSRTTLNKVYAPYPAATYATHGAVEAEKAIEAYEYADTRPFLVQGKSQKSLSAQDRPLTIEEVRDLLNKNK